MELVLACFAAVLIFLVWTTTGYTEGWGWLARWESRLHRKKETKR